MQFLFQLAVGVFFSFLAWRLSPGPENAQAPIFDDSRQPNTAEGTRVGKGFGTWLSAGMEAWSGDEAAVPIISNQDKK